MLSILVKSLIERRASVVWVLFSLSLAFGLAFFVERVRDGVRIGFGQSVGGVDLLVGAPSGDIQLLLHTVFNLGSPSPGINRQEIETLATDLGASWAVPIALGDFHRGFPVIATTEDYKARRLGANALPLTMTEGWWFNGDGQVVIGARVAESLGYDLGKQIEVTHGQTPGLNQSHAGFSFEVVGILALTGTPQDNALFMTIADFDALHDIRSPERSLISALMVGARSPFELFGLQRGFTDAGFTAVLPGVALSRFWTVFGTAEQAMRLLVIALVVAAWLGLIGQMAAHQERRRKEVALFRALGAPRRLLIASACVEVCGVVLVSFALGQGLLALITSVLSEYLMQTTGIVLSVAVWGVFEWSILGSSVVLGLLAAIVSCLLAYSHDPLAELERL